MIKEFGTFQTDILVIGSGAAGGRATIEAARNGVNVILVDKGYMGKSGSTCMTQGITRQVTERIQSAQEIERSFKVIVMLGCYLNDQNLVWIGVKESPGDANELAKFGSEYEAGPVNSWNTALRHEILKYSNATLLDNIIITKLITQEGKVVGVIGFDLIDGEVVLFKTKAVIIATGGYGELLQPSECTPLGIRGGLFGDGCILAYDAGADLCEMDFLQFQSLPDNPKWNKWYRHLFRGTPEATFRVVGYSGPYFDEEGNAISSLSTEAIEKMPLGFGPPTALTYNPTLDKQVYVEMMKRPIYVDQIGVIEKGIKAGKYKDLASLPLAAVDKFVKLDPTKFPRKVRIVMGPLIGQGGPMINEKCETNVTGLYAAGEVVGNLYGAYRQAGVMTSCLTFGRRAGKYAADYAKTVKQVDVNMVEVAEEGDRINGFFKPKSNPISPVDLKKKIWKMTSTYLNVIKDGKGIEEAIKEIEEMKVKDLPRIQVANIRRYNLEILDALESIFMLGVAEMHARAALFRTESRGCHIRTDFPEPNNENWLVHTVLKKEHGNMVFSKAPIVMTTIKPPPHIGEEGIPV